MAHYEQVCEECLYRKNCQFLAKHKAVVFGCTAFQSEADFKRDAVDDFIERIKQYIDIEHSDCPTATVFSERDVLYIVEKVAREMR